MVISEIITLNPKKYLNDVVPGALQNWNIVPDINPQPEDEQVVHENDHALPGSRGEGVGRDPHQVEHI